MDILLWRHADAEFGEPDLERPLSAKGREQAAKIAAWLDDQLPADCTILCSPATRTLQTLDALIQRSPRPFKIHPALAPHSSPEKVLDAVGWPNRHGTVLVVGHQPTLGEVAALLITGKVGGWTIRKSDVWWIGQHENENTKNYVRAVMSTDLLD